jgi:ubiquitin-conjugating enzyme E2 M
MLKLREMKAKQEQAKAAEAAAANQNIATAPATGDGSNGTLLMHRGSSKESLVEIRKQKSRDNVFSLKSKASGESASKRANAAELRAQKDIAEMSPPTGCKVEFKDPNDIMNFTLYITPNEGMYVGATFTFSITIPTSYPYDAPKVHCDTLVYHPNIDLEGKVCLNILRQDWMPVLSLGSVIFGLLTLFLEPNPDDPLNKEAATLMIENNKAFRANVHSSLHGGVIAGKQFPRLL